MKWKNYLLVFILIILGFVIFMPVLNVQAIDNSIYYTFENDYLYDGSLPEVSSTFNMRNITAGHYPATYSFENDDVGSVPDNWNGVGTIQVIESFQGHSKVMELNFTTGGYIQNEFNAVVSGFIEFWINRGNIVGQTLLYILDNVGSSSMRIYFNGDGAMSYKKYDTTYPIIFTMESNKWYHVKLFIDTIPTPYDELSVWVNGVLELDKGQSYDKCNIAQIKFLYSSVSSNYIDAIGYSWDVNNSYIESLDFTSGSVNSGDLDDTFTNNSQYLILDSENVGVYLIYVKIYFDDVIEGYLDLYLNCSIDLDTTIFLQDNYNNELASSDNSELAIADLYVSGISYIKLIVQDTSIDFDVEIDLVVILKEVNYNIGDNLWFTEMLPTNELEVDKFEFVSNSTGDFYEVGTNDIEGWNISENANGKIKIDADNDGFDKVVDFYLNGYGGHSEMNKTLQTYDNTDYMEISINGSIEGRSLSSGTHEFYINCTDIDGLTVFSLKFMIDNVYTIILFYNISADYVTYYHGTYTPIGINHELYSGSTDFDFNLNLLFYNDTIFVDYNDIVSYLYTGGFEYSDTTEFVIAGKIPKYIEFINDWSRYGYVRSAEVKLDNIGIYVNGESISTEVYPENVFLLSTLGVSLLEYNILEITFNYDGYDNNVSIYINDDIHIINYCDYFYDNVYFNNLYSDTDFNGLYLRIYNASVYNILNIKLYGVKLHNEFTGEKYPLEFDYENVNINDSYFYADDDNNLRFKLNITNDNLEYIQATFNVENIATYDMSFIYTYSKTGLGEGYLRLNYIDDKSTILYLTAYTSSNNVLLPQDKVIDSFIVLFSDNDDYNDAYTYGCVDSFVLAYVSDYSITIITVALMDTIIGLLVIILPSFLFSIKLGKKSIIPFMSIMSVVCFIFGLIPMWLFFILVLCFGALLMVEYKGDSSVITS